MGGGAQDRGTHDQLARVIPPGAVAIEIDPAGHPAADPNFVPHRGILARHQGIGKRHAVLVVVAVAVVTPGLDVGLPVRFGVGLVARESEIRRPGHDDVTGPVGQQRRVVGKPHDAVWSIPEIELVRLLLDDHLVVFHLAAGQVAGRTEGVGLAGQPETGKGGAEDGVGGHRRRLCVRTRGQPARVQEQLAGVVPVAVPVVVDPALDPAAGGAGERVADLEVRAGRQRRDAGQRVAVPIEKLHAVLIVVAVVVVAQGVRVGLPAVRVVVGHGRPQVGTADRMAGVAGGPGSRGVAPVAGEQPAIFQTLKTARPRRAQCRLSPC